MALDLSLRWEGAVSTGCTYSDYATLAELRIADIHFDQENYEEALSSSTKSSSAGRTADRR